jgi:hypothetical protein
MASSRPFSRKNTSSALCLVAEARRLERLDEVDVEVALGLRRGPVVGGAEEQVAVALDAVILPLDLVLPDLVAGDVGGLVGPLHQLRMAL